MFAGHAGATASYCSTSVPGNQVVNCGFETGDFTGWSVTGNGNPAFDDNPADPNANVYIDLSDPNSGTYDAFFGVPSKYAQTGSGSTYGPPTTLSQTFTVLPAYYYSLTFELANNGCSVADTGCPGYYNYFDVAALGMGLLYQDNLPTTYDSGTGITSYTLYSYIVATSAGQTSGAIQFDFSNDNGSFQLDDVTLTAMGPTPEPASFVMMFAALSILFPILRRRRPV
jgi:hypothetical protein